MSDQEKSDPAAQDRADADIVAAREFPDRTTGVIGLPVAGYRKSISPEALALVNDFKATEERILRQLDRLAQSRTNSIRDQIRASLDGETANTGPSVDPRWLAMGRTAIEQAFMYINRSIFQPGRVSLPEDDTADGRFHHYEGNEGNEAQTQALREQNVRMGHDPDAKWPGRVDTAFVSDKDRE